MYIYMYIYIYNYVYVYGYSFKRMCVSPLKTRNELYSHTFHQLHFWTINRS